MKYKNLNKNQYCSLIKKYGSPLYIYDENILQDRCNQMYEFKKILEKELNNVKINMHYSIKANNNPALLKVVKDSGLCVDSMSPFELHISKKCNFKEDEILYVCNNIDIEEMKNVKKENVLICLDSISQVETWGSLFPNSDIMVRINPGTNGVGHSRKVITSGKLTKFGISEENIEELLKIADKYKLNIIGVHQHLGSLFLNDKINDYILGVKEGLRIIKKYFNTVRIIDLGGGFGIPYKGTEENLDLKRVANELKDVLGEYLKENQNIVEFKFEPGRYIPCESGVLAGTVTAVKHENDTYWIGTDIGMNDLVRPTMYDSYHEIEILSNNSERVVANICGNICESGDILGKERNVILPKVGDVILVYDAGAYGYSMSSNYTGRLRPAEVLIKDDEDRLIRKRESVEYLENNIIWG